MASPRTGYEPLPRMAPFTASIGGKLYMWGGRTQDWSELGRRRLRSVVEVFDPYIEVWSQQPTTGTPPPLGLYGGACAVIADCIYICCGRDGSSYYNSLHELCVTTWKWRGIGVRNPSEGPMRKRGCRMVVYEGKLVLFGGFGIPTHRGDTGDSFTKNTMRTDGSGWTNELHIVHPKEGFWSSPANRGKRPPPCAQFTFTLISAHSAVVFGGNVPEQGRVDSVHVIVFTTMMWTALQGSVNLGLWPVGRSDHAACCIQYGEGRPQLLVTGGLDSDDKTLGDAWLLDVNPGSWKEVSLPDVVQPRWNHAMSVLQLAVGLMESTIFGGTTMDFNLSASYDQYPKLADTTVLRLESVEVSGMDQKEWVLTGITRHDQLGKPDRLREKMITLAERATVSKQQAVEAKRRAQEATTQVRALQQQLPVLKQQASRVPALEQQASRVPMLEQKVSQLEVQLPSLLQQANQVPALERQASRVPTLEQQASRVPALEQQASRVPALEQQASRVPALEQQVQRQTHQLEMGEVEVSHLRYQLIQRESEVREKEEEMGRQQQLFQVEKKEFTSQIDYLRARMEKEPPPTVPPPQAPGVQEAESQQSAQEEMEVLRRTRVEQDARMSHLEEDLLDKDEQLRLRAEEVVSVKRDRDSRLSQIQEEIARQQEEILDREREVREKEEEMGQQQQLFQVEKKELISQIDYLRARMGKEPPPSPYPPTVPPTVPPPQAPGVQEAESQQSAQEEMVVLRRTRVDQDARMSHLEEELLDKDEQLRLQAEEVVSVKRDRDSSLSQIQEEIARQQEEILDKDEQLRLRAEELVLVRREREEEVQRLQEDSHEWRERALRSEHLESGSRSVVEQYVELTEMKEEVEEERRALQLATRDQAIVNVAPPLFSYLRGAEVVAQRRFHITAQRQRFEWEENGFRLHVPDSCLPAGSPDVTLDVGVSLSGQFELPADSQLVSAVYWLRSSVKLHKPVDLKMGHCVSLTDPSHCSQLSFVITQCNQKELPYKFRPLEGGTFSLNSSFGSISRSQFSGLGIVRWLASPLIGAPVQDYCGQQILYRHPQTAEWMLRFTVVKNLQPLLSVVKERYQSQSTVQFEPFTFQLEGDTLSLEVEREGMELDCGWKIVPMHPPTVDKQGLDCFNPGKSVPGFELALEWTVSDQQPQSLSQPITLKGTKGDTYFTLRISDPLTLPRSEVIAGGSRNTSTASNQSPLPPSGDSLYSKYPAGLQGKPEMEDLTNEVVAEIPDLWQEVGIQLRVPYNDMSGYHERNPNAKRMFTYVLATWRSRRTSEYSWANLIKALSSPSVHQLRLAHELTKKLTEPQDAQQLQPSPASSHH